MFLDYTLAMPGMLAGGSGDIHIAVACATRGHCTIDIVGMFVRVSCMDGCLCVSVFHCFPFTLCGRLRPRSGVNKYTKKIK